MIWERYDALLSGKSRLKTIRMINRQISGKIYKKELTMVLSGG